VCDAHRGGVRARAARRGTGREAAQVRGALQHSAPSPVAAQTRPARHSARWRPRRSSAPSSTAYPVLVRMVQVRVPFPMPEGRTPWEFWREAWRHRAHGWVPIFSQWDRFRHAEALASTAASQENNQHLANLEGLARRRAAAACARGRSRLNISCSTNETHDYTNGSPPNCSLAIARVWCFAALAAATRSPSVGGGGGGALTARTRYAPSAPGKDEKS